jgi:DNA-binding NarL/FixJ family response regulator
MPPLCRLPGMDGFSAAREIRKLYPDTAIIILSMHDSKRLIESARQIGIRGYVTKSQTGAALVDAVDSIIRKEPFFRSSITARSANPPAQSKTLANPSEPLASIRD